MNSSPAVVRPLPRCPIHDLPLLVGRTLREVQYRYCRVDGCKQSQRTFRAGLARIRPGTPAGDRRQPRGGGTR
jgi:hypothetical protein